MTVRSRLVTARAAYVAIVLLATLSNLRFTYDLGAAAERLGRAFEPSLGWRDVVDGARNVVLFAGLGGVWVLTALSEQVRRVVRQAAWVSLGLSLTVETLQLFSPVRTASIVDVATNAFGGVVGAIAAMLAIGAVQRARGKRSYVGIPTLLIAGPYAIAALCEALAPLFQSAPASAGGPSGPVARLAVALASSRSFDWRMIPVFDIPLFASAGFLLIALAREEKSRRGGDDVQWPSVALPAALVAIGAHVAHGAYGLPVRWEAAATDALSIGFGAWAADRWLAPFTQTFRGAARARVVIMSYIALLVLWGGRPLLPEPRLASIAGRADITSLIPLASLAQRFDVFSALHVAQQFFLYLPLGALLAVWPLRRSGASAGLWPAIWTAAVIELGHLVIAGRWFDVTNFLLAFAGLGVGWVIVRRCGYREIGAALDGGQLATARAT